jgi:hypothetical protein
MAIINITENTQPEKGIDYSLITETSADWGSVPIETYFYNLEDRLPYYKSPTGTIVKIFGEGATNNIYTEDDSLVSNRILDMSGHTFAIKDGATYRLDMRTDGNTGYGGPYQNTVAHSFHNPNGESIIAEFLQGDGSTESFVVQGNGRINTQSGGLIQFMTYRQSGVSYLQLWDAGTQVVQLKDGSGSFINNNSLVIGGNTHINGEKILLDGSVTQHDGYFIQDDNNAPPVDGQLNDNSYAFYVDGTTLKGRGKDNLSVGYDLSIGSNGIYEADGDIIDNRVVNLDGNTLSLGDDSVTGDSLLISEFNNNGSYFETYNNFATNYWQKIINNSEYSVNHSSNNVGVRLTSTNISLEANLAGIGRVTAKVDDKFNVTDGSDTEVFKVEASGDITTEGQLGWTGSYVIANGDTVTVTNGLITNVAP